MSLQSKPTYGEPEPYCFQRRSKSQNKQKALFIYSMTYRSIQRDNLHTNVSESTKDQEALTTYEVVWSVHFTARALRRYKQVRLAQGLIKESEAARIQILKVPPESTIEQRVSSPDHQRTTSLDHCTDPGHRASLQHARYDDGRLSQRQRSSSREEPKRESQQSSLRANEREGETGAR